MFFRSDSQEHDKIDFEISAPAKVIVPKKKKGACTLIEFLVYITNYTSQTIRFNLYVTLMPELLDINGNVKPKSYYRYRLKLPCQADCPLVIPRDRIAIPIIGKIIWSTKSFWKRKLFEKKYRYLHLSIEAGDGGFWSFNYLDIEAYKIRFNYQNNLTVLDIYNGNLNSIGKIEDLWTKEMSTPFISFGLENL